MRRYAICALLLLAACGSSDAQTVADMVARERLQGCVVQWYSGEFKSEAEAAEQLGKARALVEDPKELSSPFYGAVIKSVVQAVGRDRSSGKVAGAIVIVACQK